MTRRSEIKSRTGALFRLSKVVRRFGHDCSGASAVEYAVITLIVVAIIAAVTIVGGDVAALYERVLVAFAS